MTSQWSNTDLLTLTELAAEQLSVQRMYGVNFSAMPAADRIAYIKDMAYALIKEVTEVVDETTWKSWATYPDGLLINQDAYLRELADCQIFLLNLMLASGITADELVTAALAKIRMNRQRHSRGYDGGWSAHAQPGKDTVQ